MINEKGITLISLVATVILLGILMALTINLSVYNGIIQKRFQVENEYDKLMENVEENVDSIQDQWGDLL